MAQVLALLLVVACGSNAADPAKRPAGGDEGASIAISSVPPIEEQKRLADQGAAVFKKYACGSCHSRSDERQALAGPALGKVAQRHLARQSGDELATRRWFYAHIRNPEGHPGVFHGDGAYAAAKMPAYTQLNDDEMRALIEFLMTMK